MIKAIARHVLNSFGFQITKMNPKLDFPVELNPSDVLIIKSVKPMTMTTNQRLSSLALAVKYVNLNEIEGDFVECGVWAGGSIAAAISIDQDSTSKRKYWLYDTFDGMTEPSEKDPEIAHVQFQKTANGKGGSEWCFSSEAKVKNNLRSLGIDLARCNFVVGDVTKTLLHTKPKKIAILRLDTDWYESTIVELRELYPLLSPGGVLIIDDYGYWDGARRAVDEYFAELHFKPLLQPIDHTGRIAIKIQ